MVVGLGNPGPKYENTRHNAGFICIDAIAKKTGVSIDTLKSRALTARCSISGVPCLLVKPQTLMNASGEAVSALMRFYKIPKERIIVISDDVNFDAGKVRIRKSGSDGGQKGLRSIIQHIDSEDFLRIRVGVGKKPHPDYDLASWVLSRFSKDERTAVEAASERVAQAVELIVKGDVDGAMSRYNG